jgi:phosphate ABC transporter phosphate-binding protein
MCNDMKSTRYVKRSGISNVLIAVVAVVILIAAVATGFLITSQGNETTTNTQATQPPQGQSITLTGAGATFPFPLLSTLTFEYNKIKPNIKFNYQSIGSGGGIRQHTEKTVDFGASDAPLTEKQREAAPNTLHIPETIGAVVMAYNIPNVPKGLKMTGQIIADIFLGKITKWNDPALKSLNPETQLPDKDILVVHRSDGSGTTFVFTDYLSKVSQEWESKVGKGTAVQWPVGLGSAGNEGVAGLVRGTSYTTGYVELAYALQNKMNYAFIQNKDGNFIEPTLETTSAAAAGVAPSLPKGDQSWVTVSIVNAPGTNSYPIASFTYLLVYKELSALPQMNKQRAQALVEFFWWIIHDGQKYAPDLEYVPLPQTVVALNERTIKSITFNSEPLLS